ncbi:MAG: exonuclease domain-containing protein [Candidatus Buchananbacteria bacterium]|nr:exonuclease domain-containing protein [Candidatus Buchananbacteria bacterium]
MISELPKQIIILDTEYTAWEGSWERDWKLPDEHREIVQVAALKIDTENLRELDSLSIFVRPRIKDQLSDYFINLTAITQDQIDRHGIDFALALEKFQKFIGELNVYSFGGDQKVFKENCELYKIKYPFDDSKFFDMRDYFIARGVDATKYQSGNITEAFGIEPKERGHNALNDCRSIVDGLKLLKNKK